jgi:UDP-3-O-[3-hydroxymyristoyl] glucosamine N-acyltransferase
MADPRFYKRAGPFRLDHLARQTGLRLAPNADPGRLIADVAALAAASPDELSYCADKRYLRELAQSAAGACIVPEELATAAPPATALLFSASPAVSFARVASLFYPAPLASPGVDPAAKIDPSAKLGEGVSIGPGAVIGPEAEIGKETVIGPYAVIGRGVTVGTGSFIGPLVSITHSLIGDRVVIHAGARLGTEGFGFAPTPEGPFRIPQLGRVIIQDDVEIGANTTIDRGALGDTVVGQGTKIDNLVQIGHNVTIGRCCVIAGLAGISGSTVLGDFVKLGGQAGLADHVNIGAGAQVAAQGGVMRDIPPGATYVGSPAKPSREFFREFALIERLAKDKKRQGHE